MAQHAVHLLELLCWVYYNFFIIQPQALGIAAYKRGYSPSGSITCGLDNSYYLVYNVVDNLHNRKGDL